MRISTDARATDIEPAVNWISGLIGAALDKRVAAFERQERSNPLLAVYFRENFALEFALAKARKYRKSTGRLPKGEKYDQLTASSFLHIGFMRPYRLMRRHHSKADCIMP